MSSTALEHNNQKKIAVISDLSGFGRCSLTVSLPIISMMKVQCCPLPTSIFSNHTGYPQFFFEDFTPNMEEYMNQWKNLNLKFNGICTGFLGSEAQIKIVKKFIENFKDDNTVFVMDPVMGDNGKTYSTYTPGLCRNMKELVPYADILTPNVTEACILTDVNIEYNNIDLDLVKKLAYTLSEQGPKKIVITGFPQDDYICNLCYEIGNEPKIIRTSKVGTERSGTGDIFSSIVAADAVNGVDFYTSVNKAAEFIKMCILESVKMNIPLTDGVCFEEVLHLLK